MEENNTNQTPEDTQSQNNDATPVATQAPVESPKPKRKFSLKKLRPALLILLVLALVAGPSGYGYTLYKKTNNLRQENKNLSSVINGYKQASAKPEKLTDETLQSVSKDIPAPTSTPQEDKDTYGGTAVQVNVDDTESANPKYIGGEYAPFWLLAKYALTIPDGVKMIRTTDMNTNGRLFTFDNEGSGGCGGEGIYITVSSDVSLPGSNFRANGSSASYGRGVGCGGADPTYVLYAKYYPVPKNSSYKYLEVVTADCASQTDDYKCVPSTVNKTKWRLFSGIVLANAPEFKADKAIDAGEIVRQLYNRDKNELQFYFDCTGKKSSSFECSAEDYKSGDFNAAIKDANYQKLKTIVLGMHPF